MEHLQNQGSITFKQKRKTNDNRKLETNHNTIFALMLAALRASAASATVTSTTKTTKKEKKRRRKKKYSHEQNYNHRLLLQLLNQLNLCLLSKTPNSPELTLPVPILSVLPLLLTSECDEVVCKCAEFVGAASLYSLEINEQISNDVETVKGLIFALVNSKCRNTSIAACNAVLDMATTSFGRKRLVESSALDCLMDDHCVFVCQLFGFKKWNVFHPKSLWLPRLYEAVDNPHEADMLTLDGCEQFLLREEFSLHLTLAIEVEPPFAWEGFTHVALHNWYQNQKQSNSTPCDPFCGSLNAICVNLMHVAIKLIGDSDHTFRKACLVGAISSLSNSKGWLDLNQRAMFSHLIRSIDAKSSFSDAIRSVTLSLQENEDPLQQMRWLQHLDSEENLNIPPIEEFQSLTLFCHEHKDEAEAAFMEVKSNFCSVAVFEDVDTCYKILLEKYRNVRKQYMDGMLSLNCN